MSNNLLWEIESVRLTLLEAFDETSNPIDLEQLIGIPAESKVEKTTQRSTSEDAPWEEGQAFLIKQPGRIDFHYNFPTNPATRVYGAAPTTIIEKIKPIAEKLSKINASRLAIGAALVIPMQTKKDSYLALNRFISEVEVDPETSDFLYQINRPISSEKSEGIIINKLTRWSVFAVQLIIPGANTQTTPNTFGVRLELDINTSPNTPTNNTNNKNDLFSELLDILSDFALEVTDV